ncbi:sugar transferase [Variovorax sp. YR752]|uniref:sugar transferase n=1 Tax=Variovorax sp. YR752 TaxID=1884383 RepID=UPI0031381A25
MSNARFIFRSQGDAVAFIEDGHVFALDGQTVGFVDDRERVYDRAGQYKGFLLRDGRVALKSDEAISRIEPPPLREKAAARPMVIPQRLPMPPLREPIVEAIVVAPLEPERRVGFPTTVVAFASASVVALTATASFLATRDSWFAGSATTGKVLAGLAILTIACALVASVVRRRSRGIQPRVVLVAEARTAASIRDELVGKGMRIADVVEVIDLEETSPPDLSRAASLLRAGKIDKVLVSDDRSAVLRKIQALSGVRCAKDVQSATEFIDDRAGRVPLWLLGTGGIETLRRTRRASRAQRIVKRAFDVVASGLLLVLQLPVMVLVTIAIKLDSPGPVLYRQERVGLGGRTFHVLKFRSMRNDVERDGVARWATKNDPRVTRVGSFIRKSRIDELPQLLCVLRGDMSMVGPRPERPVFAEHMKEVIPAYDLRNLVKPGVTGWAQVMYSYGASVEDARIKHEYDLYYIKNVSLALDLSILVRTIEVVLFSEGSR